MGYAHSDTFIEMYNELKGFIPQDHHKEVANIIYDKATDLDCDDWDGESTLEKDGNINQDLDD